MGFPEEFIKSISIRNREVSSEGLKGIYIGDFWEYESLKRQEKLSYAWQLSVMFSTLSMNV